jgi:hypothetical protein
MWDKRSVLNNEKSVFVKKEDAEKIVEFIDENVDEYNDKIIVTCNSFWRDWLLSLKNDNKNDKNKGDSKVSEMSKDFYIDWFPRLIFPTLLLDYGIIADVANIISDYLQINYFHHLYGSKFKIIFNEKENKCFVFVKLVKFSGNVLLKYENVSIENKKSMISMIKSLKNFKLILNHF